MTSWIYVFSKFTHEVLLFQALIICILCGGYAAFWILRKRKMGVIQTEVPSGVVKTYLNGLIVDAEELRAQLFGLLSASGVQAGQRSTDSSHAAPPAQAGGAADRELQRKVGLLETKMAEQTRAMETLLAEKTKLETALKEAKETVSDPAAITLANSDEVAKLQAKIRSLEEKFQEYSVIEDDLANLKRLQQENKHLKSLLANQPAAPAAAPAPTPAAAPVAAVAAAPAAVAAPAPTPPPTDNLLADIEASMAAPQSSEPRPEPQPMMAPALNSGNPDEDLIAEFEKMLNS